jgi:hypothetical protein
MASRQYIDASARLTASAAGLAAAGVKAVGRYYNYGSGSKVLTRAEAQALIAHGISIWTVFQFWGNAPRWFSKALGEADAARALQCAQELVGQPEGSTIYFGADYNEKGAAYASNIVPYFTAVKAVFTRADGTMPYRIGVYSDGLVCRRLVEDGLVTDTWLSCSSSFAEHGSYFQSRKWKISQTCGVPPLAGVSVDDDVVTASGDFGQWNRLVPLVPSHFVPPPPLHATLLANANLAEAADDDPARPIFDDEAAPAAVTAEAVAAANGPEPAPPPPAPAPLQIDMAAVQQFLQDCLTSTPRVGYGLGAKIVPVDTQAPGSGGFTKVDCSGFIRAALRRATPHPPRLQFPDGSVVQHDWVRAQGFAKVTVADGQNADGVVRIAFLRPQDSPTNIGHVALIHNGRTIESHGGVGPDSRPWTGADWQARTSVYVLT